MMGPAATVALALSYPRPGHDEALRSAVEALPEGGVRKALRRFLDGIADLDAGAWEELHTATLDLSPRFVPYVGHVAWGENYRRGAFMADLNRAMGDLGVDLDGELPDHLAPILRYLEAADRPLDDLREVLGPAIRSMRKELAAADAKNPYRHVLAAASAAAAAFDLEETGAPT